MILLALLYVFSLNEEILFSLAAYDKKVFFVKILNSDILYLLCPKNSYLLSQDLTFFGFWVLPFLGRHPLNSPFSYDFCILSFLFFYKSHISSLLIIIIIFSGFKMRKRVGEVEEFQFGIMTGDPGVHSELHITIAVSGWISDELPDNFTRPWKRLLHSREQYYLR